MAQREADGGKDCFLKGVVERVGSKKGVSLYWEKSQKTRKGGIGKEKPAEAEGGRKFHWERRPPQENVKSDNRFSRLVWKFHIRRGDREKTKKVVVKQ